MEWRITTKDGVITLSTEQLFHQLASGVVKKKRTTHLDLVRQFLDTLEASGSLKDATPVELTLMAFELGYFYRIFMKKNNVEVIEPSHDDSVKE